MIKIIPTTRELIRKFNLFGCDVSIGFAKYVEVTHTIKTKNIEADIIKDINYLIDHNEEDGIITHRFILWRFKIEVKSVVHYDYSFT